MDEWPTWFMLGRKDEDYANTLCGEEHVIECVKNDPDELEIKLEFKAPSYDVARVVEDVYNKWIADPHKYIRDLADYYGYKVEKK